jgi:putative membrane protein
METPGGPKRPADPKDYLAEERTFLAWIRTGLTLMGFGFVVARFGLFLRVIQLSHDDSAIARHGISPWLGTAFIATGVIVNVFAVRRHLRLIEDLNRGEFGYRNPSRPAIALALFLAAIGVGMAIYLTLN